MKCKQLAAISCCGVIQPTTSSFGYRPKDYFPLSPQSRRALHRRCTTHRTPYGVDRFHTSTNLMLLFKRRLLIIERSAFNHSAGNRVDRTRLGVQQPALSSDTRDQGDNDISHKVTKSTFSTAVCIVPPDDVWDTIQRARHLARDTSFYKWPPAIRLFHPFAPKYEVPSLVGKLAEWIDREELKHEYLTLQTNSKGGKEINTNVVSQLLTPFEVTLDSILILPHWEVLDARIDALEDRITQQSLGETLYEKENRHRKEKSRKLVEAEVIKGHVRKRERERKRLIEIKNRLQNELKQVVNDGTEIDDTSYIDEIQERLNETQQELDQIGTIKEFDATSTIDDDDDNNSAEANKGMTNFDGPCVIYLAPDEKSCSALESLRGLLRTNLFASYDSFSPSSSVSPYPEQLPRKVVCSDSESFRPLLPIARFPSVAAAMKIAKVLQRAWEPLSFNVTDVQFISRSDNDKSIHNAVTFSHVNRRDRTDSAVPEVRHHTRRVTPSSSGHSTAQRISVTSSGEVEDVSKQGIFGCDAMVMLLGEEPQEELIEDDASLSMIVRDDDSENDNIDDDDDHSIDYSNLFFTAEREYQRIQSHEELSTASFVGGVPIFADTDIEKWLDDETDDEGATVVVGRAQFFVGAMRDFIGMPASSVIDHKDRIMQGGVNAVARRKGSVHRNYESWDAGDYGRKDQDLRG